MRAEYPNAVAIDASVAKGRAYMAVNCPGGQVRPVYPLLDREGFADLAEPGDDPVWAKHYPLEESPIRWPKKSQRHLPPGTGDAALLQRSHSRWAVTADQR